MHFLPVCYILLFATTLLCCKSTDLSALDPNDPTSVQLYQLKVLQHLADKLDSVSTSQNQLASSQSFWRYTYTFMLDSFFLFLIFFVLKQCIKVLHYTMVMRSDRYADLVMLGYNLNALIRRREEIRDINQFRRNFQIPRLVTLYRFCKCTRSEEGPVIEVI